MEEHLGYPIPAGLGVCHHCDNPPCCNPRHLFLGTATDNMRDAVRKGRIATGERNGRAKLTEAQVLEIRAAVAAGETQRSQVARFDCNFQTVSKIIRRHSWRHI